MSLITIDQLLESVDLDLEPRWVTKDKRGDITIFLHKPTSEDWCEEWRGRETKYECLGRIKLAEFEGKDWTECIYEVSQNTTGKIERLQPTVRGFDEKPSMPTATDFLNKINELVDAVNELKGAKNE